MGYWVVLDPESGVEYFRAANSQDAYESTYTGDFPDTVEVAYING